MLSKRISLIAVFFVALAAIAQCAQPSLKVQKELQVTEKDSGKTITLQRGQGLAVMLAENGTTGYRWTIDEYKPSILELLDSTYKAHASEGGLFPTGGGGTRIFTFSTKRTGETLLELNYQRPWAETIPAAKSFSIKVVVQKADTVTADTQLLENVQGKAQPAGTSKSGPELRTKITLKSLQNLLVDLDDKELSAVSAVEFTGGANKEYVGFLLIKDNHQQPRCPNEKLPVTNGALKTITGKLLSYYGKKAEKLELAFLQGTFGPPGFCQVTLVGTGLGLYFNNQTGEPMGKLTGKL